MAPLDPLNANRPISRINSYSRSWATTSTTTSTALPTTEEETVYDWPPSPLKPSAPTRILTAHEKRMAMIQQALSQPYDDDPPASARVDSTLKRPNPFDEKSVVTKKPRVLPWEVDTAKLKKKTAFGEPRSAAQMEPVKEKQRILLSNEQAQILQLVLSGQSVFFTGSAGTGKSVLLREIIKGVRKVHQKDIDSLAITASTGIAACNIGGTTLHSFAGIGLGVGDVNELVKNIKKNKKASARWMRTKVLIIDEISMVDGDLFDKLAQIACLLRKNPKPFGGIQIVVTGDFFQLPPVMKGGQPKFAFEAQKWNECVQRTFNLTQVFRQKDQDFVDMLNEMRFGQLSQRSIQRFKSLSRPIHYDDGIEPTELFPHRDDVDRSNRTRMGALDGESKTYYAVDGGTITNLQQREKMLGNLLAPTQLTIKVGAQVMLIKNKSDDNLLVNGSMGRVLGFLTRADWNMRGGNFYNVPDPESEAAAKRKAAAGQEKQEFDFPVVEFNVPGYADGRQVLVEHDTWKVESNGEIQASRQQIPLILAWAMSIHKSQGQTLDRVKVDLGRAFEMGQAYVALSRATSLAGLQVLRFEASRVRAHPKVTAWSRTLESLRAT